MDTIESIIIGIISGVLTAALLYTLGLLIKGYLVPWVQQISYKGVDISGTWVTEAKSSSGHHAKMEMTLYQNAHKLKGDKTIMQGTDPENPSLVTNLSIQGNIWEGFITLNQQSRDRTRLSYSTTLLQVHNGGLKFKGILAYRSIQADKIESLELIWRRKEPNPS